MTPWRPRWTGLFARYARWHMKRTKLPRLPVFARMWRRLRPAGGSRPALPPGKTRGGAWRARPNAPAKRKRTSSWPFFRAWSRLRQGSGPSGASHAAEASEAAAAAGSAAESTANVDKGVIARAVDAIAADAISKAEAAVPRTARTDAAARWLAERRRQEAELRAAFWRTPRPTSWRDFFVAWRGEAAHDAADSSSSLAGLALQRARAAAARAGASASEAAVPAAAAVRLAVAEGVRMRGEATQALVGALWQVRSLPSPLPVLQLLCTTSLHHTRLSSPLTARPNARWVPPPSPPPPPP
jgi:hypothetical protein